MLWPSQSPGPEPIEDQREILDQRVKTELSTTTKHEHQITEYLSEERCNAPLAEFQRPFRINAKVHSCCSDGPTPY